MYNAFYGLKPNFLAKDMKPCDLYVNQALHELENRLEYMKKNRGIMLISGEPGTGKTTALRKFVNNLSTEHFLPLYIPLSTVAIGDFYKQINEKLHGPPLATKSVLFKSIQERILYYTTQANRLPVIIIDEAHLLKNENFFELQIITNFDMDSQDPALFVLIAQSHLGDRLTRTILESFNQRIHMKYHLGVLTLQETVNYIQHHLDIAGAPDGIFTQQAFTAVYNLSGGVIRTIGKLLIKTLTLGASLKKQTITEEEVLLASKEM